MKNKVKKAVMFDPDDPTRKWDVKIVDNRIIEMVEIKEVEVKKDG